MRTKTMKTAQRLAAGLIAATALGAGGGCARTATFAVTRPAMLNAAQVGNTMTVGGIAAPTGMPQDVQAAAEISADLSNRIAHSLNPSIRLLAQGGGVVITGAVLSNEYGERIEQVNRTCTRTVSVGNGQFRAEPYPCTDIRRIGQAHARLQFQVTHGQNGQVLFDQSYEDTATQTTVGIRSPYERRDPPGIDGFGMLHAVRAGLVNNFARVILPWQESSPWPSRTATATRGVARATTSCAGATWRAPSPCLPRCWASTPRRARRCRPTWPRSIGEAFYNRGITRSYLGRYAQAVADLTRAIALRPNESDWQQELRTPSNMARDQESLRQQGAVQNETQNVQQAGTP
jgi:hypothetical protein